MSPLASASGPLAPGGVIPVNSVPARAEGRKAQTTHSPISLTTVRKRQEFGLGLQRTCTCGRSVGVLAPPRRAQVTSISTSWLCACDTKKLVDAKLKHINVPNQALQTPASVRGVFTRRRTRRPIDDDRRRPTVLRSLAGRARGSTSPWRGNKCRKHRRLQRHARNLAVATSACADKSEEI